MRLTIKGEVDERAVDQLIRCAETGDAPAAALCADGHVGYSQPIGGVVAYRDYVSPSGVGYDIGCGNKAVKTNVRADDLRPIIGQVMDRVVDQISFGVGRKNRDPVDHPVFDSIRDCSVEEVRDLLPKAQEQLGTVGAGNHYVDLFYDEEGWVWIGVHFGSRGVGHTIASGFLAVAEGKPFGARVSEGEMDSPPKLLRLGTPGADAYIEAMTVAGEFAYAGRDVVVDRVLQILGAEVVDEVHNHHNYAWLEDHDGSKVWVVRKGATPAFPGQRGFVGATMGEPSVILRGVESEESRSLLYSTVHGAGRVMSRTQAAGKTRTMAVCSDRDCQFMMPWKQHRAETSGLRPDEIVFCRDHPTNRALKRRVRTEPGLIDWGKVTVDLNVSGITLRGGAADEAPMAYKRLADVLAYHRDSVQVEHVLFPMGVAMAGPDTVDPWKD